MGNSSLLLMALIFVSFASLGRSQPDILGLNITGRVFCSPTGNPGANSAPLVNTTVSLVCNGQTLAQTLTNLIGFFNFSIVPPNINVQLSLPNCMAEINLPVNACSLLPLTGSIGALLDSANRIDSILNINTGTFGLVNA